MIVDRVRVSQVNALKAEPVARHGIVSSRWLQLRTSAAPGMPGVSSAIIGAR